MKGKILAVIGILVLVVALLPGAVGAAPKPIDYVPMDMGPTIRGWDASPERIENTLAEAAAEVVPAATPYTECVLDTKYWLRLNAITGGYGVVTYHLVAEGPLAQIWVQTNLAWPAGDPRPTPEITCEQAQYLLGEFENNIYPKETTFFGMPDTHDGSVAVLPGLIGLPADYYYDAAGRQVVLVSNVRDENYFDPTYPNYIAGFYSPTYEIYFDLVPTKLEAFPGVYELVHTCRQAGLRVAVASSADRIKVAANLQKIGLPLESWDVVVTGEQVQNKKPAPDIFLVTAQSLHMDAADCVVVEDAVNGIEAAKAAGMRCVAVAQTFPAERLQDADIVRNTIAEMLLSDLVPSLSSR